MSIDMNYICLHVHEMSLVNSGERGPFKRYINVHQRRFNHITTVIIPNSTKIRKKCSIHEIKFKNSYSHHEGKCIRFIFFDHNSWLYGE